MLEVEIKAFIGSQCKTSVEKSAMQKGFVKGDALEETDLYFNGNDRNFMETDEALRLRICRNLTTNTSKTHITYKGPKLDDRSSTRKEYETAVEDFSVMESLLISLGYSKAFTVVKNRQIWTLIHAGDIPPITLCVDSVAGLGDYVEFETLADSEEEMQPAADRLLDMLAAFGIPRENLTRKSYLELLFLSNRNK